MSFFATIARQREFFDSGATWSVEFRCAQLRKLMEAIEASEGELLAALHADLRKSPQEAYLTEVGFVLGEIRHALRYLSSWVKPQRRRAPWMAWPGKCRLQRDPFGVSLVIGPWNYPLQLLLSPAIGGIAAGNCVILKPSEFAPRTAAVVAQMVASAFSAEYLTVIQGGRDVSEALLKEKFDKLFFTGGTEAGRAVMAAAARHLTPVTLELGGKCPCIVCHDAQVDVAARRIVWGKFLNAGQTCVSPDHVLVDQRIAVALVSAIKTAIQEFYGPCPQDSPAYSRIVNRAHFDRLVSYLDSGRISWGGSHDVDDLFIEPTVLTEVPAGSAVMREEIFGPILPVLEYEEIGEVLGSLRQKPPPLALYLFTRNSLVRESVIAGTRSGGVCVNDTLLHILGRDLPFGGFGESGMGNYHGRASFDCFSHERTVMIRPPGMDLRFRYPPQHLPLKGLKRIMRIIG